MAGAPAEFRFSIISTARYQRLRFRPNFAIARAIKQLRLISHRAASRDRTASPLPGKAEVAHRAPQGQLSDGLLEA